MTSPAQLKYLDAMGIPVWVSRDLVLDTVIADSEIVRNTDVLSDSQNVVQTKSATTSLNNHTSSNTTSKNTAQSIIDSLDQSQARQSHATQTQPINSNFTDVVRASVDKTAIPTELKPSDQIEPTSENLVFKSAQHYVFASGNETADWMVIGHSPEPFNGIGHEPFAAEAGELLVNMIRAVGIEHPRQQAYFVNVLDLDRSQEKQAYNESKVILNTQIMSLIDKVNPKMVLIVGQIAAQNLLDIDEPLIIMRSKIHHLTDKKIPCVVSYYPSYLLQKPIDKRKAWNDLQLAMSEITDVS